MPNCKEFLKNGHFSGWIMGRRPEFVDPRVVASGEGRDVTRVTSQGYVMVQLSVITKDLKRLGYEASPTKDHVEQAPGLEVGGPSVQK